MTSTPNRRLATAAAASGLVSGRAEERGVLAAMRHLSRRLRRRRLRLFLQTFKVTSHTTILDVGGSQDWEWVSFPN